MKKPRSLNWPKTIEALEKGAQDGRATPELRAQAARVARMMKSRLERRQAK